MNFKCTNAIASLCNNKLSKLMIKTFIFLLSFTSFGLNSITGFSQNAKIVIDTDTSISVEQIFTLIENQTDYQFIYDANLIKKAPVISLKKGIIMADILLKKGLEPINCSYEFNNDIIIVKRNLKQQELFKITDKLADFVKGKVTDDKRKPLAGVTVSVKGTKIGTVTNESGEYSISAPKANSILIFSYVGFAVQEVAIGNQSEINIVLKLDTKALDEIVVVGYGTQKKSDLTGSVASVKEKDFNRGINTSPDQLIQGKVAGVQISNNSGQPGAAVSFRIRGVTSFSTDTQPLFVVDGVILGGNARPSSSFDATGPSPAANPLNFINTNDIASIDVLKDASATAIYGSRAANGVVVITTKRGISGQPRMEVGINTGISVIRKKFPVLNGDEYRQLLKRYNNPAFNGYDYGGNFDAQDAILRTGITHNANIAINSGTENAQTRISFNSTNQEGIIRKSGLNKNVLDLKGKYKFFDTKWFNLDYNLILSTNTEKIAPTQSGSASNFGTTISQALRWNPTRSLYNADGSVLITDESEKLQNPLATLNAFDDKSVLNTIIASVSPKIKIIKGLEYQGIFSIIKNSGKREVTVASSLPFKDFRNGYAGTSRAEEESLQINHLLTYKNTFEFGLNIDALAGYEFYKNKANSFGFNSLGFKPFDLLGINYVNLLPYSDRAFWNVNTYENITTELQSYFTRVNLGYKNRYLLTATLRADGSNKFTGDKKYGYFPSIGAAWNLHNEEFFKSNVLNNLKLRLGWGEIGNQTGLPSGLSTTLYSLGLGGSTSVYYVGNPDLKWETTTTSNIGVDFGLFNSRLTGSIEYFDKKTNDLLITVAASQLSSGLKWINVNGQIVNRGTELTLNGQIIQTKDFQWNLGGNISFVKNTTQGADFPSINPTGFQRIVKGSPLYEFYGRKYLGLDDSGFSKYQKNSTGEDALVALGSPLPTTLVGISSSISYKKFDLNMNFQGAYGHKIYNGTINGAHGGLRATSVGVGLNVFNEVLNSSIREDIGNIDLQSNRFLYSGDYMKLANTTLTYRFGNAIKHLEGLSVYITGQNLLVITKYPGFDPELGTESIPYPSVKNFIIGVNFNL